MADIVKGLSSRDKNLIRCSWADLTKTSNAGHEILSRLFKNQPQYIQLFPFKEVALNDLPSHPKYQNHCKVVANGITTIVDALDNADVLGAYLKQLGESHVQRKVTEQAFLDMKAAAIELFSSVLKPEETEAWKKGLNAIFDKINEELRNAS